MAVVALDRLATVPRRSRHAATIGDSKPMPGYVYVLGSRRRRDCRTYVGWTLDLDRRLEQHNSGAGAKSTRGRDWVLLYAERCETPPEAMSREWHLKRDRKFRSLLAGALRL